MGDKDLNILELTVVCSIPLLISSKAKGTITGSGTGVIIIYRERYFLCTAEHNVEGNQNSIGIQQGVDDGVLSKILFFEDFSFHKQMELPSQTEEGVLAALENLEGQAALDIAVIEVPKLDNLIQLPFTIKINRQNLTIAHGAKAMWNADRTYVINPRSKFSFAGMSSIPSRKVRPMVQPQLFYGLKFSKVFTNLIRFDFNQILGFNYHLNGCSGAPIFDLDGNVVAIMVGSHKKNDIHYIYGFRFDIIKQFIDMLYFSNSMT